MAHSLNIRIDVVHDAFDELRAPLKSVMSGPSARRTERRNRSVHGVHEDFEHRPTQQLGRAISF